MEAKMSISFSLRSLTLVTSPASHMLSLSPYMVIFLAKKRTEFVNYPG